VDDALAIPIVAILMPLVLVPTVQVLKHRQRRREWDHLERMKALEMGHPLSVAHPWPAALAAIAIGLGAPFGAFLFSWLAVETAHVDSEVFIGATFVGLAGVVSGARLAGRLMLTRPAAEPAAHANAERNGKPVFDPDTYDVVGRRG
jgi:hypothetical protein